MFEFLVSFAAHDRERSVWDVCSGAQRLFDSTETNRDFSQADRPVAGLCQSPRFIKFLQLQADRRAPRGPGEHRGSQRRIVGSQDRPQNLLRFLECPRRDRSGDGVGGVCQGMRLSHTIGRVDQLGQVKRQLSNAKHAIRHSVRRRSGRRWCWGIRRRGYGNGIWLVADRQCPLRLINSLGVAARQKNVVHARHAGNETFASLFQYQDRRPPAGQLRRHAPGVKVRS